MNDRATTSMFEPWRPAFGCEAYASEAGPIPLQNDARRAEERSLVQRMTELVEGHVLPNGKRLRSMSWIEDFYPTDHLSAAEWDVFWSAQLYDWYDANGGLERIPLSRVCREHGQHATILRRFQRAGVKSVLCAGNGADQEPRVYAFGGLHVTTLDFSSIGIRLARAYPFSRKTFEVFRVGAKDPSEFLSFVRQGGRVSFAVGDFRSSSVLPGPFDAIVTHCSLQTMLDAQWAALDVLLARLAPGGIFVASFHNDDKAAAPYAKLLSERGFSVWSTMSGHKPNDWTAALFFSTG